ncbi:RNA pseudouridine synthase [Leptospira gomenensis]|uniref:RNA pseudouridine synthase n=1 Tax=Leptospira gomenensis TaxID=2484974 RepID=A0A5F1YA60_9LEPT|nr:RNA pseudouridine synthase [Leptospira gomenensis]TGK33722.1 RNA pseudouridine synthase [Leptospira gomenensis]TGK41965.1 RNA pseudouridine synthase [Leptospira gomenensis]TGK44213.1 RNA pseudouridine synthase [Leptospira gomenensis]TGK58001.1 RNA pseudouridine synthase [Leptospira gomenensis]
MTKTPIRIFYEDAGYLFAEKPAGIPVHSTKDSKRENFSDLLQKQLGLDFLRTVNRLDLETSGLVFFCKDPNKNKEADRILKESTKLYLCVARGIVQENHFTEICYLKDGNRRVRKVYSGGDKAITEFEVLRRDDRGGYSVLLAKLHTGRRHQIRFHLADKGHPIVGDKIYSDPPNSEPNPKGNRPISDHKRSEKRTHPPFLSSNKAKTEIPTANRSLLHAIAVSAAIRSGEKPELIYCPPPGEFRKFLADIRLDSSIFSRFFIK